MASKCFSCLYTKQKTQKRKKWLDGRVIVQKSGLVNLYGADPKVVGAGANMTLDTVALSIEQAKLIINGIVKEIDFEKYLCEIEGEWNASNASNGSGSQGASATSSIHSLQKKSDNSNLMARKRKSDPGMQKLLNSKFRKPTKFIPNSSKRSSQNMAQVQRMRPLQPGEYMRQFQNSGNHMNSRQNLNGHYGQNANLQHRMRPVSQRGQPSQGLNEVHNQQDFQQRPSSHSNSNPYQKPSSETFQQNSFPSTGNNNISSATGFRQAKPQPVNQNQSKSNNFVSNDFDPSSFYEESDNESEDDCRQDLHTQNGWGNSRNSNHLHDMNQNMSVGNSKEHSRYGQQQAPLSRNRSVNDQNESLSPNEEDQNNNTMTNDYLLQLFNVGDVDDSTNQSEVKDIEHSRNINEKQKDMEQKQNYGDSHLNFSNNPFLKNLLRSDEKLDESKISLGNAVSVECEIGNTTQTFSGEEDDDESRCDNLANHCKSTNSQSDDDAPISFDINCNDLSSEESSDDNE